MFNIKIIIKFYIFIFENKIFNYSLKEKKINKIKNELKLIKFRKKMKIILNLNLINDFINK